MLRFLLFPVTSHSIPRRTTFTSIRLSCNCFQALEEYVLSTEIEVPVYFAEESEDLDYLAESLQGLGNEKSASAAQGKILAYFADFM